MRPVLALLLTALFTLPHSAHARSVADARKAIVDESVKYLNVPYLWGGKHPQTGLDCSGFVQLVYEAAGLGVPRMSREQFTGARYLSPDKALPGDMIFFAMKNPGTRRVDHVGIYMGKGYFIHASFSAGIHIDRVDEPYYFARLVGIRRYRGF